MASSLAAWMKPHVLTMMTSAREGSLSTVYPFSRRTASICSESTRFLLHPRETNPTVMANVCSPRAPCAVKVSIIDSRILPCLRAKNKANPKDGEETPLFASEGQDTLRHPALLIDDILFSPAFYAAPAAGAPARTAGCRPP